MWLFFAYFDLSSLLTCGVAGSVLSLIVEPMAEQVNYMYQIILNLPRWVRCMISCSQIFLLTCMGTHTLYLTRSSEWVEVIRHDIYGFYT